MAHTFDELQDTLSEAKDLDRQAAFVLLREKAAVMEDSLLRTWFMREMADLLGLPLPGPNPLGETRAKRTQVTDPTHYREILARYPKARHLVDENPALIEMFNEMQQTIIWAWDNLSLEEYKEFLSWFNALVKEHHVSEWEK